MQFLTKSIAHEKNCFYAKLYVAIIAQTKHKDIHLYGYISIVALQKYYE
jgi:hypothetical protein